MAIVKGKEKFNICFFKSKSLGPKDFLAFCVGYMMKVRGKRFTNENFRISRYRRRAG